jgi:hypothetical protein
VTMMEPTHLRNRDDPSSSWRLDRPGLRAVLRQCQMRPAPVRVVDEVLKMSMQAALAENDHGIQALRANPVWSKNSCGVILRTGTPHHESSGLAVLRPTHRPSLMAFAAERMESQ